MQQLAAKFKRGRDSSEDELRSSRPKTLTTDEQIDVIHSMVLDDRPLTVQLIT